MGRKPGVYTRYDVDHKREVHLAIFAALKQGLPFNDACWYAEVDPNEIRDAMASNPHVRCGFKHQVAKVQLERIKKMREGGRGLSPAKVAQLELEAQDVSWAKASDATLAKRFEDALEQLEKLIEPKAFEIVVRVLTRFA